MFITVRFGDDRQELFNPHSKISVLLENIKERCDCQKDDVIDLSDSSGNRKNLSVNPKDYAIKHVDERDVLVLVKIERFPGSLNESCVPLLHDLQGDKDFLENLNKSMYVEPNSEDKPDRTKRGNYGSRRASVNLKRSTLAVPGAGKRNRTLRSQSVAIGTAGSAVLLKSTKKAR